MTSIFFLNYRFLIFVTIGNFRFTISYKKIVDKPKMYGILKLLVHQSDILCSEVRHGLPCDILNNGADTPSLYKEDQIVSVLTNS